MIITVLRSKLHRCVVTISDLHYEGSIGIDRNLLDASGILPNEKVEIYNVSNGQRFSTYVIEADAGSRTIAVNGAAARLVQTGDILIICAFGMIPLEDARLHEPKVILVDEVNRVDRIKGSSDGSR